jgi:hypothetical protein
MAQFLSIYYAMWPYGGHFQLHMQFHPLDRIGNRLLWLVIVSHSSVSIKNEDANIVKSLNDNFLNIQVVIEALPIVLGIESSKLINVEHNSISL